MKREQNFHKKTLQQSIFVNFCKKSLSKETLMTHFIILSKTYYLMVIHSCSSENYIGLALDEKPNSDEHIQSMIRICNKLIRMIKRLSPTFSYTVLLAILTSSIRSRMDYI